MVEFASVRAGDVLYDARRVRAGNTTMRVLRQWKVLVVEVNAGEGWALCSWNGNAPERWSIRRLRALRRKPVAGAQ